MRALAARLGVVPGALYRHVRGKEQLCDLVVDGVLAEVDCQAGHALAWAGRPVPGPGCPRRARMDGQPRRAIQRRPRHPPGRAAGSIRRRLMIAWVSMSYARSRNSISDPTVTATLPSRFSSTEPTAPAARARPAVRPRVVLKYALRFW